MDNTQINPISLEFFLVFVLITLGVTYWAARRSRSSSEFYTGGGNMSALGNGLAIAGDFMSAAALLGVSAMITQVGFDGMLYGIGFVSGWPIVLALVAERLRRLGRFTFADALSTRVSERPIRIFSALSSLIVIAFYLIAQMVGAGQLVQLLFGLNYNVAIVFVGGLMVCYVIFGGMLATSWVQIIKAVLLLCGTALVAGLTLEQFHFSLGELLGTAVAIHPHHAAILAPSALSRDPVSGLSLGIALMFGTSGLPHILMRFFTVPDVKTARVSIFYACLFNGIFFLMVFIIGFGAIGLVMPNPAFHTVSGALRGGANMVTMHLAYAVGGSALMGFISAIAFATILAVVAGLTLSGASTISHDLYACLVGSKSEKHELAVMRAATLVIGVAAIALGIIFRNQNVAYMVGLALSIAASANFPVLLLALRWDGITTAGALYGGIIGLVSAFGLTLLGPSVWVKTLNHPAAVFPWDPPAIFTVPLTFVAIIAISLYTKQK